ncbi:nucleolar protein NOP52 variant [Lojkania enalia]|uniref:Nucleolar protein NOP52 variant n=1 Tax=Lojkania enalia TaxID=147567 RepID=A0A9P4KD64_9PLEO|nr:nucleolar protein NOP52 variant [Didymosphaeria enalia]
MASEPQNSPFIKNLASSEKKIRDQALSSLRTYLSAQKQISQLDILKLWKGLFYCLWMQDKPVHQQRLARDLAGLVGVLQGNVELPFLEAFWRTMGREWGGIDALRMDKYLYLIRQYLNASFRLLSRNKWGDESAIDRYVEILEDIPLNPTDPKILNGLRYHVLDIYVDEMEKVCGEDMGDVPVEKLLEPVEKLKREGRDRSVRKSAEECLGDDRVRRWKGEEVDAEGEGEDDK